MAVTVKAFRPVTPIRVMLVGAQPSVNDIREGFPFAGASGDELTKMLHEAGFIRTELYITHVSKRRLAPYEEQLFAKNKTEAGKSGIPPLFGKYPKIEFLEELGAFNLEVQAIQPTLIIALGEAALWATTGLSGITNYRGSILPGLHGCKVVPTFAPSKVMKKWDWRWLVVMDLKRALAESEFPEIRTPAYQFLTKPSYEDVIQWLQNRLIMAVGRHHNAVGARSPADGGVGYPLLLSVDIETRAGHIDCLGLADSPLNAICIPFMSRTNPDGYWTSNQELMIIYLLQQLLTHPAVEVVGQNFLYDAQYIAKWWGFLPNITHDTMIEHHVAFAGLPKGLDFLSSMYCDFHSYWKDERTWPETDEDEEQNWTYNCKDCVITYEVNEAIQHTLTAFGLEEPAKMQMRLWRSVFRMMLRGTRIDLKRRSTMAMELMEAIASRQQWLLDVVGDTVPVPKSKVAKPWYSSPTQLKTYLYDVLGLPEQRNRKTGRPTTDDSALDVLRKREPAIKQFLDCITELRSLGVFYNTFVQAPLDTDNRIRCSFNPAGTETYRFSSSSDAFGFGTNLQNIPKGN